MAEMQFADLEQFYDRLAQAIDDAGEEKTALFLSKFALLMARETGDLDRALLAIELALRDVD